MSWQIEEMRGVRDEICGYQIWDEHGEYVASSWGDNNTENVKLIKLAPQLADCLRRLVWLVDAWSLPAIRSAATIGLAVDHYTDARALLAEIDAAINDDIRRETWEAAQVLLQEMGK